MLHVTLRYRDASGRLFETNCDATRNPFSEEAAFATGVSGLARRQQSLPESGSRICSRDQEEASQRIRKTQKAEFFYAEDTQLYTAMFPDSASARDCVDCHNRHGESPKKDWKLGDMMGAITWTYPAKEVSHAELLTILAAVHQGGARRVRGVLDQSRDLHAQTRGRHAVAARRLLPAQH